MNKIIFLLLLSNYLLAITLDGIYYVQSNNIKLRDVVPDAKYDLTLYKIDSKKYTKKVKSSKVIKLLNTHGFENLESKSRYIKFIKKSPIDLSSMESYLYKIYKEKYKNILIHSIMIIPKAYISALPDKFSISIGKKAYLLHNSTMSIKTIKNKKLFFDYIVDADIDVYISKRNIRKGDHVSLFNVVKKTIHFDKFRSLPIDDTSLGLMQLRTNLRDSRIITRRDVTALNLVSKGSSVNVTLKNKNLNISFLAVSIQNGKLNDIITVQKKNKQKIKVTVIGKNRVEIR